MPVPHLELGRIYERTRRWPQAAASLQRAAQLAPKDPRPHFHLARVWERQNQPERAAAARRRHKELAEAEEAEAAKQLGPRQTMR